MFWRYLGIVFYKVCDVYKTFVMKDLNENEDKRRMVDFEGGMMLKHY